MRCISCGAPVDAGMVGAIVKCDFCGTSNAFTSQVTFNKDDPASLLDETEQRIFLAAVSDIEAGEYEDAYKALSGLLKDNSSCWQVHTNLALCIFALGSDDFAHLPEVIKHLRKALSHSTNQAETIPYIKSVSFNVAQVCAIKNRYGQSLLNCIAAIEKTVQLTPDFPERDLLINEFVEINQASLVRDALALAKREKKNFDPPRTLAETLIRLTLLAPGANRDASALAIVIAEKKNLASPNISATAIDGLREAFYKHFNTSKKPTISFPIFGDPKISS